MPVGSLPAFNLLGGEEAQRREAERKEAERKAGEKSTFTGLWEHATGKDSNGEKKKGGDSKAGLVPQVGNLWDLGKKGKEKGQDKDKGKDKGKDKESFRLFGGSSGGKKKSAIDWGPGGALGIGCGVGVGVALTGGAGVGATPWSALRVVFGVGAGCGIGVGFGYGYGIGLRWDKPPEQVPKRVVIEL